MSDYLVHINVPKYVADFITHHFGSPVELDKYSVVSRILKTYLTKLPDNCALDNPTDFNLHIRLPFFKEKDPRTYFYLSPASKKVLAVALENLFEINMWAELLPTLKTKVNTSEVIYAYLERHGIDDEQHEAVRQKFYRLRKKYFAENNIKL